MEGEQEDSMSVLIYRGEALHKSFFLLEDVHTSGSLPCMLIALTGNKTNGDRSVGSGISAVREPFWDTSLSPCLQPKTSSCLSKVKIAHNCMLYKHDIAFCLCKPSKAFSGCNLLTLTSKTWGLSWFEFSAVCGNWVLQSPLRSKELIRLFPGTFP